MTQDRSALLQQLKLEKKPAPTSPKFGTPSVLLAVVSLVIGFVIAQFVNSPAEPNNLTVHNADIALVSAYSTADTDENSGSVPALGDKVLDASGYVTARRVATVSAEVMGLLLSVDVDEGMLVQQGQVLAQIDDSVARIQLRLAQAQVETQLARVQSLQVELAEAQRESQRLAKLGGAGDYASESQLSRARTAVDRLLADIRSAQAELRVTGLQVERQQNLVDDHRIRAPFGGVVIGKSAQAGEIVAPSSAGGGFTRTGICTIVDMQSLEIEVDVNEAFIGRVQSDQAVVAKLDAYPRWQIPAKVIAVIPTADRSKATVRVRIQIIEKDSRILPDMGVKVSFLAEEG